MIDYIKYLETNKINYLTKYRVKTIFVHIFMTIFLIILIRL